MLRDHDLSRYRKVKWTHQVPRSRLSVPARNSLGAILALFRPSPEAAQGLWRLAGTTGGATGGAPPEGADHGGGDESETILREEVKEKAEQFIEDRLSALTWDALQDLVAGVLRAMGYRTRAAAPGPDRGVDIFAGPTLAGRTHPVRAAAGSAAGRRGAGRAVDTQGLRDEVLVEGNLLPLQVCLHLCQHHAAREAL